MQTRCSVTGSHQILAVLALERRQLLPPILFLPHGKGEGTRCDEAGPQHQSWCCAAQLPSLSAVQQDYALSLQELSRRSVQDNGVAE